MKHHIFKKWVLLYFRQNALKIVIVVHPAAADDLESLTPGHQQLQGGLLPVINLDCASRLTAVVHYMRGLAKDMPSHWQHAMLCHLPRINSSPPGQNGRLFCR